VLSSTDSPILSLHGVTKRYGELLAVDHLSLDIQPGEIFALLGPNGAGKTTLIECICGLIARFEGEIRVAGLDVRRDYRLTRRLIGLVPQELNFDGFFNAREALRYQAGFFGVANPGERADRMLADFSLSEKATANTRWLSGGMKRRLMICKALMHEPALLFLDEPTAGVDVDLRDELWAYVRRLRERGTTVVLTTHYLEEAEQLADRIGVINRGSLIRVSPRDDLMRELGRRWVTLELAEPPADQTLAALKEWQPERATERQLRIFFGANGSGQSDDGPTIERVLGALRTSGARVVGIETGRSSLEEIFRHLVREHGTEKSPSKS
jgi:ABC-2 type transport system ATP-binding protein